MKYQQFQLSLILSLGSLLLIPSVAYTHSSSQLNFDPSIEAKKQVNSKSEKKDQLTQNQRIDIQTLAANITVKVYVKDSAGSGIIINKQGNTYTVLTNAHVITRGKPYRIKTSDHQVHQAILKQAGKSIAGNDLAVLEFQSTKNYQIAKLGNWQDIKLNDTVYTTGFPYNSNELNIVSGKITLIAAKPLKGGYQIGYTNQTQQGMSGGALLNSNGEVIGVIGMGDNAIFSQDAYTYQDDTQPDINTVAKMKQSSFAVPINTLAQVAPQLTALLPSQLNNITVTRIKQGEYEGRIEEVNQVAQEITVKIESEDSPGSGVIIASQGNTYYVLTAFHVMCTRKWDSDPKKCYANLNNKYNIITYDNKKYFIDYQKVKLLEGVDLAILEFTTVNEKYKIADLAKYDLKDDQLVFSSGFPSGKNINDRQYHFTIGFMKTVFEVYNEYSLLEKTGSELTYSNISYPGMSGGGIFDFSGNLIGINTASEGSLGVGLGVPIKTFLSLLSRTGIKAEWLRLQQTTPSSFSSLTEEEYLSIFRYSVFNIKTPTTNASVEDWMNYGEKLLKNFRYKEAIGAFNRVIEKKPYAHDAYYAKSLAYKILGNYQEALLALENAINIDPKSYHAWREKARIESVLGKNIQAINSLDKARLINQNDFLLYLLKGNILIKMENYTEALKIYNKGIKAKKHFILYKNRGIAFHKLGQYQKAITDYSQAIKTNPASANAYFLRGITYDKLGEYQKASSNYSQAIKINSSFADAYYARGGSNFSLNRYEESINDYTKAIQLKTNYLVNAYYERSRSYLLLGQAQKAIDDSTEAIKLNTKNLPNAYAIRGTAYLLLKNHEIAIYNLSKAIQLKLEKKDLIQAYWNRGNAYFISSEYQKAITDFSNLIDLDSEDAQAYLARGSTYLKLGNKKQAIPDLQTAAQLFKQQNDLQGYQIATQVLQQIQAK